MGKCNAVLNGLVRHKGKPTAEWAKNGKPQYYCYGYIDPMYDAPLPECEACDKFYEKAQSDFEAWNRRQHE